MHEGHVLLVQRQPPNLSRTHHLSKTAWRWPLRGPRQRHNDLVAGSNLCQRLVYPCWSMSGWLCGSTIHQWAWCGLRQNLRIQIALFGAVLFSQLHWPLQAPATLWCCNVGDSRRPSRTTYLPEHFEACKTHRACSPARAVSICQGGVHSCTTKKRIQGNHVSTAEQVAVRGSWGVKIWSPTQVWNKTTVINHNHRDSLSSLRATPGAFRMFELGVKR